MRDKGHDSDSRIASLKAQNKEYNEMYKKWRIDHKNNFGFYFSGDSDELTWRDGEGFVFDLPEVGERLAVTAVTSVIAKTLLIFSVLDIFCAVIFSDRVIMGQYVALDPRGFFVGDDGMALLLSYIVNILRRAIPVLYVFFKLKIPLKLVMPMKVSNKPLFNAAAPMALLTFGLISIMSGFGLRILSSLGHSAENLIWIPKNSAYLPAAVLLYAVIIPIMSELVHRGVFLQILRQFGDGYAILVTSIIATLTTPDLNNAMFIFTCSMVTGYLVLKTGSILSAFVMRIITALSSYWLTYFKMTMEDKELYLDISYAVLTVYIIIGLISLVFLIKKHSSKINLPIYNMYVPQTEKLMVLISDSSMLIWIAVALLSGCIGMVMR